MKGPFVYIFSYSTIKRRKEPGNEKYENERAKNGVAKTKVDAAKEVVRLQPKKKNERIKTEKPVSAGDWFFNFVQHNVGNIFVLADSFFLDKNFFHKNRRIEKTIR